MFNSNLKPIAQRTLGEIDKFIGKTVDYSLDNGSGGSILITFYQCERDYIVFRGWERGVGFMEVTDSEIVSEPELVTRAEFDQAMAELVAEGFEAEALDQETVEEMGLEFAQ